MDTIGMTASTVNVISFTRENASQMLHESAYSSPLFSCQHRHHVHRRNWDRYRPQGMFGGTR